MHACMQPISNPDFLQSKFSNKRKPKLTQKALSELACQLSSGTIISPAIYLLVSLLFLTRTRTRTRALFSHRDRDRDRDRKQHQEEKRRQ